MTTLSVETLPDPVAIGSTAQTAAVTSAPGQRVQGVGGGRRLLGIDVARVLAATAIVLHHAPRSDGWTRDLSLLGRFSTPLFSLLAAFFIVRHFRRSDPTRLRTFFRSRVVRLVVPFVAWSVIYWFSRDVNHLLFGRESTLTMDWNVLWAGTSYHLWFLPFLIIMSLASLPLIHLVLGNRRLEIGAAIVLFALGFGLTLTARANYLPAVLRDPYALEFMLYFRSPAFLWGLALGFLCVEGRPPWLSKSSVVLVGAAVLTCLMTYMTLVLGGWVPPDHSLLGPSAPRLFLRMGAAGMMFIAFANWRGPLVAKLSVLGTLSYGVYLTHVLFVEAGHSVLRKFGSQLPVLYESTAQVLSDGGVRRPMPTSLGDICVFVFALLGAFALTWVLRSNRWTKWLIP